MLYNLSEHQIEALSNLLRGNDCFISQPTGSGLYEAFQLLRSNDVYVVVEPKTQEIVIPVSNNLCISINFQVTIDFSAF